MLPMIRGDAVKLRQVFTNLLTNAVKFTPAGGRIEVRLDAHGDSAKIQVADTGQGIDPALLTHVFDRFWQSDTSMARVHGGLGLGLAIVRHIVEMHGGTVRAESPGIGLGATFTVELPLVTRIGHAAPESDDERSAALSVLEGAYIVVIDDEPDSRELVASVLAPAGAEVVSAADVTEGLRAIYERAPDLVISDIGMPHGDGFELLRQLKLMGEPHASTPAIALTAYAREDDRQRALGAGFQAHIGKPFDVQTLLVVATELIKERSRRI